MSMFVQTIIVENASLCTTLHWAWGHGTLMLRWRTALQQCPERYMQWACNERTLCCCQHVPNCATILHTLGRRGTAITLAVATACAVLWHDALIYNTITRRLLLCRPFQGMVRCKQIFVSLNLLAFGENREARRHPL